VGGTMLYFKALREGLDTLPESDPALRAALDAEAAERGWPALHSELARVDPATAARLAPTDAQRIQRALEVWRASGRPLSAWQAGPRAADDNAWPLVALEPAARPWLHERIAQRFAAMLEAGLVDEVRALRARGDLHPALPSMRSVGYRQAWAALDEGGLDRLPERGIAATRQLAKRQLTWLRSMPARVTIPCDDADALRKGLAALRRAAAVLG
jgi:tRNA dimethylallyltransferase